MDKKLILIVDDEPDILRLVKFGLEKHGYDILTITAMRLTCRENPNYYKKEIKNDGEWNSVICR